LVSGDDECGGELAGGASGQEGYRSRGDGGWLCDEPHESVAVAVRTSDGEINGQVYGPAGFVDGDGFAGDRA
jgi:hypothetical protein